MIHMYDSVRTQHPVNVQVAPPLRIMVRNEIAATAWHDQGAYVLLDQCLCPPAHATQHLQVSTSCVVQRYELTKMHVHVV
jgi:hypothetical protein